MEFIETGYVCCVKIAQSSKVSLGIFTQQRNTILRWVKPKKESIGSMLLREIAEYYKNTLVKLSIKNGANGTVKRKSLSHKRGNLRSQSKELWGILRPLDSKTTTKKKLKKKRRTTRESSRLQKRSKLKQKELKGKTKKCKPLHLLKRKKLEKVSLNIWRELLLLVLDSIWTTLSHSLLTLQTVKRQQPLGLIWLKGLETNRSSSWKSQILKMRLRNFRNRY